MKNSELNDLLLGAQTPDPGEPYWRDFPGQVTRRLAGSSTESHALPINAWWHRHRWLLAASIAGLVVAFFEWLGRPTNPRPPDPDRVAIQTCFEEINALFPGRLRSVADDGEGLRMDLADSAVLPRGPRIYLKICGPRGCTRFVTSSGQQIRYGDAVHDVLTDGEGNVVIAGLNSVWTSADPRATPAEHQIEAQILEPGS